MRYFGKVLAGNDTRPAGHPPVTPRKYVFGARNGARYSILLVSGLAQENHKLPAPFKLFSP